jgi:RNA polymerase sigma-70 factor (ECF subfamily)
VARTDLARALAALPVDQRVVVLLVDAEGLDYDTAAAVLGVAAGTIASRLSRARAALRNALSEGESR